MNEQDDDRQDMQEHGAGNAPYQSTPLPFSPFLHGHHVSAGSGNIQSIKAEKIRNTPILFQNFATHAKNDNQLRKSKKYRHKTTISVKSDLAASRTIPDCRARRDRAVNGRALQGPRNAGLAMAALGDGLAL